MYTQYNNNNNDTYVCICVYIYIYTDIHIGILFTRLPQRGARRRASTRRSAQTITTHTSDQSGKTFLIGDLTRVYKPGG